MDRSMMQKFNEERTKRVIMAETNIDKLKELAVLMVTSYAVKEQVLLNMLMKKDGMLPANPPVTPEAVLLPRPKLP